MDKKFLTENNIVEPVNRYNTILEYVKLGGGMTTEAGEPEDAGMPAPGNDPSAEGGQALPPPPGLEGEAPAPGGGDPAMGGAPAPGEDPAMGGAPAPEGEAGGVEGFAPEGEDVPMPDAGTDEVPEESEDEEVIDVDELVDSQEDTEKKLSRMSKKFDKLIDALSSLERNLDANSANMENIRQEIEKRNPTPVEKLSLRSRMSGPFDQSVDDYWDEKEATSPNYSAEDDNNGEDDQIYKITKSDIDDEVNWQEIARSLDDDSLKPMGLRDILDL